MIFKHETYADDETGAVIHCKTPVCPGAPLDDRPAPQFFSVCEHEIDAGGFATDEFQILADTLEEAFANFPEAYSAKHAEMGQVIAEQKRKAKQAKSTPKIIRATGDVRRFR